MQNFTRINPSLHHYSVKYLIRPLFCLALFNTIVIGTAQAQQCPYNISLVSRSFDTASNQTIFVWKVVNPIPGNGNNGTVQDLSHWGFMTNSCQDPTTALKDSDIVSAGIGSTSNPAEHNSKKVKIERDPSQDCTGNTPVLKFDAGGNGSTPGYYSLQLKGNWGTGDLNAYYKSGSRTGCGLCTTPGAGVGCRSPQVEVCNSPAPAFTPIGPLCAGVKALLVATFPAGTSVSNVVWSGTGVSDSVFTAPGVTSETSYPVNYSATVNSCTVKGSISIVVRPIPIPLYLAVYDYCPGETGGRIEVRNIEAGVSYQVRIVGGAAIGPVLTGAAGANLNFTNIPAGYYQIVATYLATGCVNPFGGATVSQSPACTAVASVGTGASSNQLEVVAYPNPFSDQIRFSITSPQSGKGILRLFDLNGVLIKTLDAGIIRAGQKINIDYVAPAQHRVSMTYKLNVGNQEFTGKLINIK